MAIFLRTLKSAPRRLLISRTDRIGDFVLTLPVFEALKRHLDLHLTVLCNEMVVPLLQNNPYVDEIIAISKENQPQQLAEQINNRDFDAMLVLVNDPITQSLLPLVKTINVRIGPLSKPGAVFRFTHPVIQKRSRSVQNEAEYNLELLRIFGIQPEPVRPTLYITEEETASFIRKFPDLPGATSKKIILHAGMGGSALNMSNQFYQQLAEKLVQQGHFLLLTGSGDAEAAANQQLIKSLDSSCSPQLIDLSNQLNLREFAILLSLSTLFIGPSTGPTHLANAAHIPVISFYPPIQVQSATRWQPFMTDGHIFSPDVDCQQKYRCLGPKCKDYYCMDAIGLDEVLQEISRLINP